MREVWIVDLGGERVKVYRDPQDTRYADVSVATRGEHLACLAFPDVPLTVDEIVG
jgi:Uma2 family endonuclease